MPAVLAKATTRALSRFGLLDELTAEFFRRQPRTGVPWLVLVDGVDEIPDTDTRRAVLRLLAGVTAGQPTLYRFVVATRPLPARELDTLGPQVPRFQLQPFSGDNLLDYATKWFRDLENPGRHAKAFISGLQRSRLDVLARTPLMASMLCQLYAADPTRPLPEGRTSAYKAFVDLIYEQNTHKPVASTHDEAIQRLKGRHQIPKDNQGPLARRPRRQAPAAHRPLRARPGLAVGGWHHRPAGGAARPGRRGAVRAGGRGGRAVDAPAGREPRRGRPAGGPGGFHTAGVFMYKPISDTTLRDLEAVLRPKLEGGRVLDRLFDTAALDHFVLFSSGNALLASPHVAAGAAANAGLDAIARARRARGLTALSVNWGFWTDRGMAARAGTELGRNLIPRGMTGFTSAAGLAVLDHLLATDAGDTLVMPVDWARWRVTYPAAAASPFLRDVIDDAPAPASRPTPPPPPVSPIPERVTGTDRTTGADEATGGGGAVPGQGRRDPARRTSTRTWI